MMPRWESNKIRATPSSVAKGWRRVARETSYHVQEKSRQNQEQANITPTKYHLVYHLSSRRSQSERRQIWFDMGHLPYWKS
jgi:hypothetical protein